MTKGKTPLVGVTTYRQDATWGPWQRPAAVLPVSYVDCVAGAGGRPLLLPPSEGPGGDDSSAAGVVSVLDALVLVGGGDVDPAWYGAPPDPATSGVNRRRDESELALLGAALAADLPVLAICRGMQLLNVHLGGSLHQHVPDVVGHPGHQPAVGSFGPTEVRIEPGSLLSKILDDSVTVQCSHHQAVDRLGVGLVVTASAPDGVVEAVELPSAPFVVGVEWHPEQDGDHRLFEALVVAGR
ncbi:MAG TPA: gamma-glutamyl-gamma-aminobutyrate hydrolase family protein [Acidimicrobiales bacterium]|nr:gamma-glutamyl-gamma-aminobutyrate hydrolase family protein [Acidimicrobiales bacterium]